MVVVKEKLARIVEEKKIKIEVTRWYPAQLPNMTYIGVTITNLANGKELVKYATENHFDTHKEVMERWTERVMNL